MASRGPTAQVADATLTLECKGTATIRAAPPLESKPHPLSMGLIVDFTTRTAHGTTRQGPYLFDDQLQIIESNGAAPREASGWNDAVTPG